MPDTAWRGIYEKAAREADWEALAVPQEWQTLLADKVRSLAAGGRVLEAGSGYGLTSLLLGSGIRRTLLDLEPGAMQLASTLFARARQAADLTVGDLFRMPFVSDSFEVVFNAGVVEHFGLAERRAALLEMARVTRPGGYIIAAFPNLYSLPYQAAYHYRKKRGKWQYPEVAKIYDFTAELEGAQDITTLSRETCALDTAFRWLKMWQRPLFRLVSWVIRLEGYLTVVTMQKRTGPKSAL